MNVDLNKINIFTPPGDYTSSELKITFGRLFDFFPWFCNIVILSSNDE